MGKPGHDYYSIDDLLNMWKKLDESVTKTDIIKWGASEDLQFSILIIVDDKFEDFKFTTKYQHPDTYEPIIVDEFIIKSGEAKLFPISKTTINHFIKNEKNVRPQLLPDCTNCQGPYKECRESCIVKYTAHLNPYYVSYSGENKKIQDSELVSRDSHKGVLAKYSDILDITKEELVIEHNEAKQFEKKFFQHEEATPLYIDPENEFYSVTLDVAIKTWKAIFMEKKNLDEKSAVLAGKKYLESSESGCKELLKKNLTGKKGKPFQLKDRFATEIAKIAIGDFSRDPAKWKKFKQT